MSQQIILNFPFRLISKDNEKIANRQGRFFLSKKFKDWEKAVKDCAFLQYGKNPLIASDIEINVSVDYTNKVHPDTTNLFKGLCDALQNIVYCNDRQIKKATITVKENAPQDSFQVTINSFPKQK